MALHAGEHVVRDVLQGDVEVVAHVVILAHNAEQVHGEVSGVGIMQSNPLHARNVCHLFDELWQALLVIEVNAVICKLLCDNLKLLYALLHQLLNLSQDVVHGAALVFACNNRYSAVGAVAIATFRYLNISVVGGSCNRALCLAIGGRRLRE